MGFVRLHNNYNYLNLNLLFNMSRLIKFIADLRIAILLLFFIIVFSILGSIIEQEKTLEFL